MVAIALLPPEGEPVSRDEAKAHARISSSADDIQVDHLITAARTMVETRTGRALMTQGWRLVFDRVPPSGLIRLAPAPVMRVDAVTVYGADGHPNVVPQDAYAVDTTSVPGRLKFHHPGAWPMRSLNGVEIDLTVGYGAANAVPAPLKQAISMLVAFWYEHREAAQVGALVGPVESGVAALLAPYRVPRLW